MQSYEFLTPAERLAQTTIRVPSPTPTALCPACFTEVCTGMSDRSTSSIILRCPKCDATFWVASDLAEGLQMLADVVSPGKVEQPRGAGSSQRSGGRIRHLRIRVVEVLHRLLHPEERAS